MQSFYPLLLQNYLFQGFNESSLTALLAAFGAHLQEYSKGEVLLLAGEGAQDIGILLRGRINAEKSTASGALQQFSNFAPGEVFGDILAGSAQHSPVTLTALEACTAVLLPAQNVFRAHGVQQEEQMLFLRNLLGGIGGKYFALSHRADLMALPTLRGKIGEYLLAQSASAGSKTFSIPMGRSALANYLNCERSALSRELGRMKTEGLITFYKNSFKLLTLSHL